MSPGCSRLVYIWRPCPRLHSGLPSVEVKYLHACRCESSPTRPSVRPSIPSRYAAGNSSFCSVLERIRYRKLDGRPGRVRRRQRAAPELERSSIQATGRWKRRRFFNGADGNPIKQTDSMRTAPIDGGGGSGCRESDSAR
jgi:hypothetical protein